LNPYATPVAETPQSAPATSGFIVPWLILCTLAVLTLLAESVYVIFPIVYLFVTVARETGFASSEIVGWPYLIGAVGIFATHLLVLVGSIAALRRKHYPLTRFVAILSLMPVISPLYLVGIPFAVWALVVKQRQNPKRVTQFDNDL
jgi:hypothetical protein